MELFKLEYLLYIPLGVLVIYLLFRAVFAAWFKSKIEYYRSLKNAKK